MAVSYFNLAVVLVVLLGFYMFPKIVERFVSITLGIIALISGKPVDNGKN